MDLSTKYMGLELKNPVVASAGPLSSKLDGIKKLEDAGASAVVLFSLFEEQIRHEDDALDHFLSYGGDAFGEALSYFPEVDDYQVGPTEYLNLIRKAKESCSIPIIGSLNGVSKQGWIDYARQIQDAGADGLELNVFFIPTNIDETSAQVEQRYVDVLRAVKKSVTIPVAMKLSPYFSSMAYVARQLDDAGADALVLFNRFYQPDFDIDALDVDPTLYLSSAKEIRLPLLWTAILHERVSASLGASTGVHTGTEVAKYLLAGADAVMTTSATLLEGPQAIGTMLSTFTEWAEGKEYESVAQIRGAMSQKSVADPQAFERANYIKILEKYKNEYCAG